MNSNRQLLLLQVFRMFRQQQTMWGRLATDMQQALLATAWVVPLPSCMQPKFVVSLLCG